MSVLEGEGRVAVKEALPALGMLTMFLFAWGLMKLLDRFCRALFGTAEGAVGWIPFAGRLAKQSIHKIEQKVSNYIGSAERGIDAHIAASYHKLAAIVRSIPSQLVDDAGLIFGLAAALVLLPSTALVKYLISHAVKPLIRFGHEHAKLIHRNHAQTQAVAKSVAQGVYPRLKVGEHERAHVLQPGLTTAREQAKAAERTAIDTYKYLTRHRTSLLTGVFTGAVAWALARVGGGWIRCANWRKIGKRVCRMPMNEVDNLLALLALTFALASLLEIAKFSHSVTEDAARGVADLLGIGDLPRGQFTIDAVQGEDGLAGFGDLIHGHFTIP